MQGLLLLIFAKYFHLPFLRGVQTETTRTGLGGYWVRLLLPYHLYYIRGESVALKCYINYLKCFISWVYKTHSALDEGIWDCLHKLFLFYWVTAADRTVGSTCPWLRSLPLAFSINTQQRVWEGNFLFCCGPDRHKHRYKIEILYLLEFSAG